MTSALSRPFRLTGQQADLLAFWDGLRGVREMPDRSDLLPEDLQPWIGWLHLLEAIDGGQDFVYRVFGSGPSSAIGVDYHRRRVSDWDDEHRGRALGLYRDAFAMAQPGLQANVDDYGVARPKTFMRLITPFSSTREDGGSSRISHLLVHLTNNDSPLDLPLTALPPPYR